MLFIYDSTKSEFRKIKKIIYLLIFTTSILLAIGYGWLMYTIGYGDKTEEYDSNTKSLSTNQFSEETLIKMMNDLSMRFPHIVLAQSILETGFWKSTIFVENHNLFGMKEAKSRITTALGTNKNHAHYNSWRESVYDFAFYQCRYLSKIKNEDEYYAYLSNSYAQDSTYTSKLKNIVGKYNLKNKFSK